MSKRLFALLLAAAPLPAMAATITYGGVAAPGGGFTTALTGPGVTVETFNGTTGPSCGLTSGVSVTGNFHIVQGSVPSYYAAPAGDTTCYMSVPKNGGSGTATMDVSSLVAGPGQKKITEVGLYWGSIDLYNFIRFYDGANLVTEVRGQDVLSSFGIAGNQSASGSNRYVNIHFSPNEIFNRIQFVSNGIAFEFDNLAFKVQSTAVPEPGMLGLLGGGLGLLALARRRKPA